MAGPRIYVGTSGWSYPTGYGKWKGVFYPKKWNGDELAYYAERFNAVEVNASFYRIPSAETARSWVERTPATFKFCVKMYRKFTHPEFYAREENASPEITPEDIVGMRLALDALAEGGRLGAVLVQYPDFFYKNEGNVSALARTLGEFTDYPLAVELRNNTWDTVHTRELLEFYKAAYVRIDEPFFENLNPPYAPADTLQYWRFHGRNEEWWRKRGAGHRRYDYLYPPDEITQLAEAVKEKATLGRDNFVFFNNHPGGKAAANAVQISSRLKLSLPYGKFANLADAFPELRPLTGNAGGQIDLLG